MATRNSLLVLYGNVDFDGRAKRMIEIAGTFGPVSLIDAAAVPLPASRRRDHLRVVLKPEWGVIRRHVTFWWRVVYETFRQRPNIVFSENFFTTFPGWIASRMVNAKLVYDAYELIIPERGVRMTSRDCVWYMLERLVVHRAALVIAANPERAEMMARHYGLTSSPTYMQNIPRLTEISPEQRAEVLQCYPVLKRRGVKDQILLYQGNVSLSRGLARFVEVLDCLPEGYRLVVVGDGPGLNQLKELAAKHYFTGRFSALGAVPNDVLPAVTEYCDIGVVTYPFDGLNNIYCAPNKLFEYAQAGVPIIASNQPPIYRVLSEFNIGEAFGPEDSPETLARKIVSISNNMARFKAAAREFSAAHSFASERARVVEHLTQVIE
jgi:glycosyltransferase involved in cell wall biosynthesis